ncbi:30S ribosomal protein S18 [bacterium]|nr:30S ribosomal protein S18 [bacterium]
MQTRDTRSTSESTGAREQTAPRDQSGSGERRGGGSRERREGGGAGGGYRGSGAGRREGGSTGPGGRGGRPQRRKRRLFGGGKVCPCCVQKVKHVDYKDADYLQRFVSNQGRIVPRRLSGTCAKHQRMVCNAIKRARNIALLPFTA